MNVNITLVDNHINRGEIIYLSNFQDENIIYHCPVNLSPLFFPKLRVVEGKDRHIDVRSMNFGSSKESTF